MLLSPVQCRSASHLRSWALDGAFTAKFMYYLRSKAENGAKSPVI
ncbi:hypothetical protein HMPREF1986_01049 [Oribacterium sp. oral taxon 078 str. F0263]|nr:hypothetical protein HMPREF1986_01049 [Oribacterium sp. oral taxon 078 str. F0263]